MQRNAPDIIKFPRQSLPILVVLSFLTPFFGFGNVVAYNENYPRTSRSNWSPPSEYAINPTFSPGVISISPSSGIQGKDYEVLVTSEQCLVDSSRKLSSLELYAPDGSGVRVTNSKASDCHITAKLTIATDAPLGVVKLQLVEATDKNRVPNEVIDFTITGITQGPIPPGLNGKGEVDVMWEVVPDKVTSDNFGGKVKRQFYCIEVVIGNDSGFDLQLSSIGFTLPGLANAKQRIPSTGYRTVRGSLEAFQLLAPRNFVINGLKVLGPLLTGFLPFFHVEAHARNFSEAINVISNPLEKGVENFWPDLTPRELDRLADMTFRDDISTKTIVPNNVQARILTFVPKEIVFPHKKPITINNKDLNPYNIHDVMRALGEIVIVGQEIVHVNRVRVVSTGLESKPSEASIAGKITDVCNVGVAGVSVVLSGGSDFTSREVTTVTDGTYVLPNIPVGRTYSVAAKKENLSFHPTSPGSETFMLSDNKTNLDFGADYGTLVISGKVVDNNSNPVKDLSLSLSPTGLVTGDAVKTNEAGVFRFEIPGSKVHLPAATYTITPNPAKHTFDAANRVWKCDQRAVDFVATPKPSASPSPSQ